MELTKGQWNPKKRFRTKKELRQIMLYYTKKPKANKKKIHQRIRTANGKIKRI